VGVFGDAAEDFVVAVSSEEADGLGCVFFVYGSDGVIG